MEDLPQEVREAFRRLGKAGGKKRMASMNKRQRREFAMKGVAARRKKKESRA